eukprot:622554-Pelagomonas_calceolata.AAC.1
MHSHANNPSLFTMCTVDGKSESTRAEPLWWATTCCSTCRSAYQCAKVRTSCLRAPSQTAHHSFVSMKLTSAQGSLAHARTHAHLLHPLNDVALAHSRGQGRHAQHLVIW